MQLRRSSKLARLRKMKKNLSIIERPTFSQAALELSDLVTRANSIFLRTGTWSQSYDFTIHDYTAGQSYDFTIHDYNAGVLEG
jgi:hypothetical protein